MRRRFTPALGHHFNVVSRAEGRGLHARELLNLGQLLLQDVQQVVLKWFVEDQILHLDPFVFARTELKRGHSFHRWGFVLREEQRL